MMSNLRSKESEVEFFESSLKNFATPDSIFYKTKNDEYMAYWIKGYKGKKYTLQSRNSLIGKFTEKYCVDVLDPIVKLKKLFAVNDVVCESIGLTSRSPADVVIAKRKSNRLSPEEIVLIFEVKMSLVWNWQYNPKSTGEKFEAIGDYMSHQGNPGLLRSDSMLKAIGKAINIRVSSVESANIPIIILGNTPITESYFGKVDHLKTAGIIQGFWSVNSNPIDNAKRNIKNTPRKGFLRMDTLEELKSEVYKFLSKDLTFFSSMKNHEQLGKLIEIANKKETYKEKGEEFIRLLRNVKKTPTPQKKLPFF